MMKRWLNSALLLCVVGLMGCRAQIEEQAAQESSDDVRLGEEIEIKLADWLELPRAKLADMASEVQDRMEVAFKVHRSDAELLPFLPDMRLPQTVPVLHQAKYSTKMGISLPPYLREGQKDAGLALHLARHGDVEAALKLADPSDRELLGQIKACQVERNYPVEWTRLVAMTLMEAQLKVGTGEVEGATELVLLHRQLRSLLGPKAVAGPLGADLLPVGLRTLRAAVVAWRESNNKLPLVADEIEQSLKEWGDPPVRQPVLKPGASRSAVANLFHEGKEGKVLAVHSQAGLRRLFDVQEMPIINEGVVGVLAFFNDQDQLGELWYLYRGRIGELFPGTTNLAHFLVEQQAKAGPAEKSAGLPQQSYLAGPFLYQFTLMPRSPALGALVRVVDPKAQPLVSRLPDDPLDLGLVNLNRTYEGARVELTPEIPFGEPLKLTKTEMLARLTVPVGEARPAEAVLARARDANLLDSLTLHWSSEDNMSLRAWPRLLLPLWLTYGPCRLESQDQYLDLIWEQAPVRVSLALPFNGAETPELIWTDTRRGPHQADRLKTALALEEQLRKDRLEAARPLTRLPRFLHWAALELGLTRDQVAKELPQDIKPRPAIKTADGSLSMLFTGTLATATATPAQLMLRFSPEDKLVEVRLRYREGPAKITADHPSLLNQLKKSYGQPEPLPAPWLGVWTDKSQAKVGPVYYRWQDDRTLLTYQGDAYCLELTLTDCPADHPQGVPLPRLDVCPRGVEACRLGDSREEIYRRWRSTPPTIASDGGMILRQPAQSPYDLCVVYIEKGKVSRILGRHRTVPTETKNIKEDFSAALDKAWGSDLDRLGVVRRIDRIINQETGEPVVRGYSWHDDRTRVHTFVEKGKEGYRMFTEWREWPVPAGTTTVSR